MSDIEESKEPESLPQMVDTGKAGSTRLLTTSANDDAPAFQGQKQETTTEGDEMDKPIDVDAPKLERVKSAADSAHARALQASPHAGRALLTTTTVNQESIGDNEIAVSQGQTREPYLKKKRLGNSGSTKTESTSTKVMYPDLTSIITPASSSTENKSGINPNDVDAHVAAAEPAGTSEPGKPLAPMAQAPTESNRGSLQFSPRNVRFQDDEISGGRRKSPSPRPLAPRTSTGEVTEIGCQSLSTRFARAQTKTLKLVTHAKSGLLDCTLDWFNNFDQIECGSKRTLRRDLSCRDDMVTHAGNGQNINPSSPRLMETAVECGGRLDVDEENPDENGVHVKGVILADVDNAQHKALPRDRHGRTRLSDADEDEANAHSSCCCKVLCAPWDYISNRAKKTAPRSYSLTRIVSFNRPNSKSRGKKRRMKKREEFLTLANKRPKDSQGNLAYEELFPGRSPFFCIFMTIICVIIFILFEYTPFFSMWADEGMSIPDFLVLRFFNKCEEKRWQIIWRSVTYQLCHLNWSHVLSNCSVILILGIPIERIHGTWKTFSVFQYGVIAGALTCGIFNPYKITIGASGGAYCLIGMHAANVILNWNAMVTKWFRLICLVLVIGVDLFLILVYSDKYKNISLSAHGGGFLTGLVRGLWVLENYKLEVWEYNLRIAAFISVYIYFLFAILYIALVVKFPPGQGCY